MRTSIAERAPRYVASIGLLALFLGTGTTPFQVTQEDPVAALGRRLQELVELRATSQIPEEFFPHVRKGGALAADGRAIALVARAAIETGALRDAEVLLSSTRTVREFERVAIERARLALERDALHEASQALVVKDTKGTRMRYPDHPEAWMLFARTHARLQDYENAERAARNYLQRAPRGRDSAIAWQIRTDAALRRDDAETAHACLAEAKRHRRWHELLVARRFQCRRDPTAELPQLGLALLWMEAEQFDEARPVLSRLTQSAPNFCRAWFHLGETERHLGRAKEAERAYSRALVCDPKHAPSRANRAGLRLAREDLIGARLDYEALLGAAAGMDARYLEAHVELARILLRHAAPTEAKKRYAIYRKLGGRAALR